MLKWLSVALMLAWAPPVVAQTNQPDFSSIDPVWAAGEIDNNLQNGESKAVWRSLKRNFPDDYQAFVPQYVQAIIKHEDAPALAGAFLQKHIADGIPFAAQAPAPALARLQRTKAQMIERLAKLDVEACAVFAAGGDVQTVDLGEAENRRAREGSYEISAAFLDAVAAGRTSPQAPRTVEPKDVAELKRLIVDQGATSAEADAVLSGGVPAGNELRCRYNVLLFKAIAAAPDETAAKFAIRRPS